jgi:hypothetical protein
MNDAVFKPSLNVESFIGENSSVNTERFLLFMKAYYEWMQSTTLSLSNKTGTFVVGETVVGATSGALATIKEVKTNSIVIAPTSRTVFAYAETVTGQTSGATATINIIKDNVGRASGNILNYKNLETSVDKYVDYLKEELYPSIPATHYGDKRLVAQYFKDFFESKSNEQSYRFLFRLLYDENIDFYYPGEDILRISDGNFEKTQVIRTIAVSADNRDIFLFLNKTIRGQTSNVLANVVDIKKFFIGSIEIAEMTLKLVSGTFAAGEDIADIDDEDLSTTIYGIISSVTIVDGGSGYEDGDIITITGNGSEAQARVSSIKESPITALTVNTVGHGYQLNTNATIDNSGTGGSGFLVQVTALANTYSVTSGANTYTVGEISGVSILNRGEGYFKKPSVTLQDTTIASLGLLSNNLITIVNAGSNYGVGNTLVFTGGAGTGAAGRIASVTETTTFDLLFEDGFQMKADGSYYDIIKNEDWLVKGPIKRIELTNFGTGYTSANLPSISITTTTGASANLVATNIQGKSANVTVDTSNNITGIGSIRAVQITNFGINYSTANAAANTVGDGNANLVPVISGLGIREGVWLDDDGKIDNKIIQDSYYYQDYSYVIKSGLAFETYSDTLKSIIHPAGLLNFGEIQILSELNGASSLVENIQRLLVKIFTHLTVGGQYEYSNISMTLKVHSPLIDTSTNLLNVQEYVVKLELVPEETSEVSIAENSFVIQVLINDIDTSVVPVTELVLSPEKSFIDVNANLLNSVTKLELVSEETSEVSIADISYSMQIDSQIDTTSLSLSLPASKLVISYANVFLGYGILYEDISMSSSGVFGEDWPNTTIETLESIAFGDFYYEDPPHQSVYSLIDKIPDVVSVAMSSLNQEYSVLISSLGFMNYTTECIITTSSTSIDVIYIESVIDTSSSIAENSFVIKVPVNTADNSAMPGITELVLSPEKSFIDVNANLSQNTLELKLISEETSEVSIVKTTFVQVALPINTTDTSVVPGVTELVLAPENSFIDVNANLSVQEYVVSVAPQEIPNNLETANTTYISYQQISGTVTSTVQDYSNYTLSAFENVPISAIDNVQFNATAPVIVGTGTNFVADFNGDDVFVANNEYFIVQAVFGATNLVIDRNPATPFTNVVAYKINP